ncbi:hypothetical protein F3N42_14315 [Marinihelvus fidelis]|uniref:Uncharacterized protein n=1 Tax=Marinihelvus fidelis TaxID=2613842 RepID=A0A5N0T4J1_9GAMM|nr:hypothetical protein [Marinihelvus fidelis]KAA9129823.1 hypothetical protein F3N42_14315 [Marinihelvus fidelis]
MTATLANHHKMRCLRTRNGCLFLRWSLDDLRDVLEQFPLNAADFELEQADTRRLLRDLFMLSAQESLEARRRRTVGRLARALLARYQQARQHYPAQEPS